MPALWVGLVALALSPLALSETCPGQAGTPGLPGIPGMPGRDGRDGEKGEKGAPGEPLQPGLVGEKGQKGEPGPQGVSGKIGRTGPKGPRGAVGPPGEPGEKGKSGYYDLALQSAFSVTRRTTHPPREGEPVLFTTVITNINGHFDIQTGKFRCKIPGTYYFVYHASSKDHLCVNLMAAGKKMASFCDHKINTYQVNSGGLAVRLRKDEEVWLETTLYNQMLGTAGKESVFSGFLLYPE